MVIHLINKRKSETVLEQAELFTKDCNNPSHSRREVVIGKVTHQKTIADRIKERENSNIELKSSFRYDIKLKQSNPKVLAKDNRKNNSKLIL